jgi:pimeloyl-ACP methyl ester carboxylesterase
MINADLFVSSIRGWYYLEMKKCGHTPYIEEPLKFAKAVIRFLE